MAFSVSYADATFTDASFAGLNYADEASGFPAALAKMVAHVGAAFRAPVTGALAIATGTSSGTVFRNLPVYVGQPGRLISRANGANFMRGTVSAWTPGTGAVSWSITSTGGTGTLADFDWVPEQPTSLNIAGMTTTGGAASADLLAVSQAGADRAITLGILAQSLPTALITRDDASTNTALAPLVLRRTSSGTPAAGIGAALAFEAETASNVNKIGAVLRAPSTNVGTGTEAFDFLVETASAGALAEAFRVSANRDARVARFLLVGNGASGAPSAPVHAILNDAGTSTVGFPLRVDRRSTGTPAAGIGAGLELVAETAANTFQVGGTIGAVSTAVGAGAEAFDLVLSTMAGGAAAAERFRARSDGRATVGAGPTATLDVATKGYADSVAAAAPAQKVQVGSAAWAGTDFDTGTTETTFFDLGIPAGTRWLAGTVHGGTITDGAGSGTYTFRVRIMNASGVSESIAAEVPLRVINNGFGHASGRIAWDLGAPRSGYFLRFQAFRNNTTGVHKVLEYNASLVSIAP